MYDIIRSIMKLVSEIKAEVLNKTFMDMEEEAKGILYKEGFTLKQIVLERKLNLRYFGQSYELEVAMLSDFKTTLNSFHLHHREACSSIQPVQGFRGRGIARYGPLLS